MKRFQHTDVVICDIKNAKKDISGIGVFMSFILGQNIYQMVIGSRLMFSYNNTLLTKLSETCYAQYLGQPALVVTNLNVATWINCQMLCLLIWSLANTCSIY